MLFLFTLFTGLKPVVNICRSYGTFFILSSFRRVETRRY